LRFNIHRKPNRAILTRVSHSLDTGTMSSPIIGSITNAEQGNTPQTSDTTRSPKLAKLVASRVYGQSNLATNATSKTAIGLPSQRTVDDFFESSVYTAPSVAQHQTHAVNQTVGLPFYRNPAQQVEVATAIAVGRTLDVRG
jgi:hypothetical protein